MTMSLRRGAERGTYDERKYRNGSPDDDRGGPDGDEKCIKHTQISTSYFTITTSHHSFTSSNIQFNHQFNHHRPLNFQPIITFFKIYTFITITTLFAAALAAPAKQARQSLPTLNFSVANDVSGANVGSSIIADGTALTFSHVFAGTALQRESAIIATSIQSTSNGAGIFCIVSDGKGNNVGLLNEQSTFVDLDGQEDAVETDVSDFTLLCEA
ncbi:hypothetical protein P171DRAFT_525451 [Karstenula rhodostoma CBS 690.94]|uniref:Uncharacterized protein n=1 Tax=Karstenula rhodostoma CBS 690.94 TaxID=1392251 RepID=A0A9P4U6Z5_9PLEO|nr:hypothetical protein P171DRAFT_525451 [Karstenula rhodostoma CBS 690.94]